MQRSYWLHDKGTYLRSRADLQSSQHHSHALPDPGDGRQYSEFHSSPTSFCRNELWPKFSEVLILQRFRNFSSPQHNYTKSSLQQDLRKSLQKSTTKQSQHSTRFNTLTGTCTLATTSTHPAISTPATTNIQQQLAPTRSMPVPVIYH